MQMRFCIRAELSLAKARTVRLETPTPAGLHRAGGGGGGGDKSAHKHQIRTVLFNRNLKPVPD